MAIRILKFLIYWQLAYCHIVSLIKASDKVHMNQRFQASRMLNNTVTEN